MSMSKIYALPIYSNSSCGDSCVTQVGLYALPEDLTDLIADELLGTQHREDGNISYKKIKDFFEGIAPKGSWCSWEGWGHNGGSEGTYLLMPGETGISPGETLLVSNGFDVYPDISAWIEAWEIHAEIANNQHCLEKRYQDY